MFQVPEKDVEDLENDEDIQELIDGELGLLPDGAGHYAETNPEAFIMEPYNAISSLAFLIPVFYFTYKLRKRYRDYVFLTYCMPLLFIGGIGSTVFHAFRLSWWLLLMDVLPIAILTLSVSVYFWLKILKQKWLVFIMVPSFVIMRLMVFTYFNSVSLALNISYFITGIMIFVPAIVYLRLTKFLHIDKLIWAVGLFVLALVFRRFDFEGRFILPMGTHWLWHVSCAIGALMLGEYLYEVKKTRLRLHLVEDNN